MTCNKRKTQAVVFILFFRSVTPPASPFSVGVYAADGRSGGGECFFFSASGGGSGGVSEEAAMLLAGWLEIGGGEVAAERGCLRC